MHAIGVLVAPELTYNSAFGWHFHIHLGILCLTQDRSAIEAACRDLVERYICLLTKSGYQANWEAQHVSFPTDSANAAEYMGKGAAWEIAGGTGTKISARRHGSLTPFQIAAFAAAGNAQMKKLFLEYAEVMPGTRSCIITEAISQQLGLQNDTNKPGPHDLDEQDNIVGTFPNLEWNTLTREGVAGRLLNRLELEGSVAWPDIKRWALSVAKKDLDEIAPLNRNGSTTTVVASPPVHPAIAIADRAMRFTGGGKLIREEMARLTRERQKFKGQAPPSISEITAALAGCRERQRLGGRVIDP